VKKILDQNNVVTTFNVSTNSMNTWNNRNQLPGTWSILFCRPPSNKRVNEISL